MPIRLAFLHGRFFSFGSGEVRPCVDKPDVRIDGFPTYKDTIYSVEPADPLVMPKLRDLARRIVLSHRTRNKIIGFEVYGHADFDLNPSFQGKPLEREKKEKEVSTLRAYNAREVLLQLIEEEGGTPIIAGIRANARALGVGSKCLKVKSPSSEFERKKNRRVEIFLVEFSNHPVPPPQPDPPQQPEPGTRWRIQIKNGQVASASIPIPETPLVGPGVASIDLEIEIIDRLRREKARFHVDALAASFFGGDVMPEPGPEDMKNKTKAPSPTSIHEGPPRDFWTTGVVTLDKFAGSVKVGQNGNLPESETAEFFFFDFEALTPQLTVPKVLEVKAESLPNPFEFSIGLIPLSGTVRMLGSPAPAGGGTSGEY
jgi:hypothetical protein